MVALGSWLATVALVALLAAVACLADDADRVAADDAPYLVVLGIAQDAGYPQAGCAKACCAPAWRDPAARRHVSCLAIVDPASGERWIIDATPDFREQLRRLDEVASPPAMPGLAGILLTHAHIGHYTGLMFVGHESIGAKSLPVHAMPRMRGFLTANGPWDQLVRYGNIELRPLAADVPVHLNDRVTVTPLRVPHREEYTEVVGFRIEGPAHSALFIPDIDKWERWDRRIETLIAGVDVAYLDGTFFSGDELPNRDLDQIPHPLIADSMNRFGSLPPAERAKIRFIHLNHSNPALHTDSGAARSIRAGGFGLAEEGERVGL